MFRKKLLAVGIAAVIAASSLSAPVFADKVQSSMSYAEFREAFKQFTQYKDNNGKHKGKDDKDDDKDDKKKETNITNLNAVKMIVDMMGLKDEVSKNNVLHPLYNGKKLTTGLGYIYVAIEKGILQKDDIKDFNPLTPIKRYQAAKYIVRALGMDELAQNNMDTKLGYKDESSIPKGNSGYVYVAASLELMEAEKSSFQPNKSVTTKEMETIVTKAKKIKPNSSDTVNNDISTFVSINSSKTKIKVKLSNNTYAEYNINSQAPVYLNNSYTTVDTLKEGDTIKLIFSRSSQVIFIEVITQVAADQKLTGTVIDYNNLPEVLKAQVDTLKLTSSYKAFRYGNHIYLVATMGQKSTSGYSIGIKDVYKVTASNNLVDIKATVEQTVPSSSGATLQVINYPYSVIRIDNISNVQYVKYVDTANSSLAQVAVTSLDVSEIISGTISSVDASNRKLKVLASNNIVTEYAIPAEAVIKLNNTATQLSSLAAHMNVVVTRSNSVVISVSATDVITVASGTISQLDSSGRKIKVTGTNNVTTEYTIPSEAVIKVNNVSTQFASLAVNMNVSITKTNNIITLVAATDTVVETSGTLLAVMNDNGKVLVVKIGNEYKNFRVDSNTIYTVNGQSSTLDSIPLNSVILLKHVNSLLKEVKLL